MSSAAADYNIGGQLVRNYNDEKRVNKGLGLLYSALDEWITFGQTHEAAFAAFFIAEGLEKIGAPRKDFLNMLSIAGHYLKDHKDSSLIVAWDKMALKLPDEDRYLMLYNANKMTKRTAENIARKQIADFQKPLYHLQDGNIEPYQLDPKQVLDGPVTRDITTTDENGIKRTHTVTRPRRQSPEALKKRTTTTKEEQGINFREVALGALFKDDTAE